MEQFVVRPALLADVPGMAAVHVRSWQEAYRGLISDGVLDDPQMISSREAWWTRVLTEGADGTTDVAVALQGDEVVGLASAGAPRDADATWPVELTVLYTLARIHGRGAGALLLNAVIGDRAAALWVADPNPRATHFYRKHGFVADGVSKVERVREIRLVRPPSTQVSW